MTLYKCDEQCCWLLSWEWALHLWTSQLHSVILQQNRFRNRENIIDMEGDTKENKEKVKIKKKSEVKIEHLKVIRTIGTGIWENTLLRFIKALFIFIQKICLLHIHPLSNTFGYWIMVIRIVNFCNLLWNYWIICAISGKFSRVLLCQHETSSGKASNNGIEIFFQWKAISICKLWR